MEEPQVRLLASTNNARGDLFTRLAKDLFFALGYDDLRLDVHKAGREIDVEGRHRLEPRYVFAECKAHSAKMGGDALNKFFGALTREREKRKPRPVAGYFVSLSGFTETGIEQELETGDKRLILLSARQVVSELVRSRLLVGSAQAAERAGRCVEHAGLDGVVLDVLELLGHQRGYIWAVFYSRGKERGYFSLIHADGTPLAEAVAMEVISSDRECGGRTHTLEYLPPAPSAIDRAVIIGRAAELYRNWLAEECGYIQLDGLPADTDLSATRLKLENLFVPLKVKVLGGLSPEGSVSGSSEIRDRGGGSESQPQAIGQTLRSLRHNVFLAAPGAGKSTLVKRLALAYAFPDRRVQIVDGLPERDWLPLFLRCRELRERAHRPILELLDELARHAGMSGVEIECFHDSMHEAMREGKVLLLVDGLDEISDEGARRTFAQHLRTFLGMFPQVRLVVTSREAGFRPVAGVIASVCKRSRLAPFAASDVQRLCERWFGEVVGDNDKVQSQARELASAIWDNKRIRTLARNPLLLTTLLVVRRWIGELPSSRAALYRETVRVLIRTWNVEGYRSLDEEEALAQLSYLACYMMEQGTQRIAHRELLELLRRSRQELEAELQLAEVSVTKFVELIEYRSSLLMQTGHELVDGVLQPVYEFRHLTFQEYLAARGYVEEQYPGRALGQSLSDLLEPRFEDERWREVIPLAAVLAGRKAEPIIKRLTSACEELGPGYSGNGGEPHVLLRQCLLDGVQVTSSALRAALLQVARNFSKNSLADLRRGRYRSPFREVVEDAYFRGDDNWEIYLPIMQEFAIDAMIPNRRPSEGLADSLMRGLAEGDRLDKVRAAFTAGFLASSGSGFTTWTKQDQAIEGLRLLRDAVGSLLDLEDLPSSLAACWALSCIGMHRLTSLPPRPGLLISLYRIWREAESEEVARYAAWAFATQPLLPRDTFEDSAWGDCESVLRRAVDGSDRAAGFGFDAAMVIAWYRRAPWEDSILVRMIAEAAPLYDFRFPGWEMLRSLGKEGRDVLREWEGE